MEGFDSVEADIRKLIGDFDPDVFVVEIKLTQGGKRVLYVLLDTDEGITIDQCAAISRKLNHYLEEEDPFPFAFNLEVSSPGVGRPLVVRRQYHKNVGRKLSVRTTDGDKVKGVLSSVAEDAIVLTRPPKKKKKKSKKKAKDGGEEENKEIRIQFESIQEAKVEISFD